MVRSRKFTLHLEVGINYSGISVRLQRHVWHFYWRPYCPQWIDKDGTVRNSGRFSLLHFKMKQ